MSFPRLYLASGVTARTAGTLEPYTDLNLKKMIDQRRMPGPKMLITVGYLDGNPTQEIADIEKVRLVFRDGIGFDSRKLMESVWGHVGLH